MLNNKTKKVKVYVYILMTLLVIIQILLFLWRGGEEKVDETLRKLAKDNNFLIGAAVSNSKIKNDSQYKETLIKEFNAITLENDVKFSQVHPEKNHYNFINVDQVVDFALQNHMKIRGHTLVWHGSLPSWIKINTYTRQELIQVMKDHIHAVVGRYKGKIFAWDVVNEAFTDDGNYRSTIWYNTIGPEYIALAFQFAHEADPDALLFYNDFSIEGINPKSNKIYNLLKKMKEQGIPIHGVGFQMHFTTNSQINLAKVTENMNRLHDIDLTVHFTEVDIAGAPTDFTVTRSLMQAIIYSNLLRTCLNSNGICSAFVLWGFTDKYTWREKGTAPLIFDEHYRPKISYDALKNALK